MQLTRKQAIEAIQKKCPKFSKIQMTMVSNPDYGVALSAIAKSCINVKSDKRKKNNRYSFRVDDVVKERIDERMKDLNFSTFQGYLEWLVRNDVG